MKSRFIRIGIFILYLALTVGCAVVTTYGVIPQLDTSDNDTYLFTYFYSQFTPSEYLAKYAESDIEKFMSEKGYLSYRVLERYSPNIALNKVLYKVRFWRSKEPFTMQADTQKLMIAAGMKGDVQETAKLIVQGADVNAEEQSGWTPLTLASSNGHAEVIKLLLAKGADVNKANSNDGLTALMAAAAFGHIDSVKALIAGGANLNAVDHKGNSALELASLAGHNQVVELLRTAGAK